MAVQFPLPADLPINWSPRQIIAPTGEEVGLTQQHGYNYLMQQINTAQEACNLLSAQKVSIKIIPEGEDIPVPQRQPNTYYLKVTDTQSGGVSGMVYVSPDMSANIID